VHRFWKTSFLLPCAFAAAVTAIAALALPAQDKDERPKIEEAGITEQHIRTVEKGLAWLARNQNDNGSWTCKIGCMLNYDYISEGENDHVGVTALACIAFMASGSSPGRGKYGKNIDKGLDFIISTSAARSDGYISIHGTRMYEHAFCTMCLAEAYGMSPRKEIERALKDAVAVIVRAQNQDGGWRYQPVPRDADVSVTVSILQALRGARNVGIVVPKDTIDSAMKFIHRSARADGSFDYQIGMGDTRTSFALTACGVVSLCSAGEYNARETQMGIRYLQNHARELTYSSFHYFYGHYYAVQAFYQAGQAAWNTYFPAISNEIMDRQFDDGHWEDDVGPAYATAMACIILQIPCEYLPIFQK
jgi:hypothetical protein